MKKYLALTAIAAVALTGCVTTDMRMGSPEAKTVATGAAGGASAENANTELERCDSSLGTISWSRTRPPAGTPSSPSSTACRPPRSCCA